MTTSVSRSDGEMFAKPWCEPTDVWDVWWSRAPCRATQLSRDATFIWEIHPMCFSVGCKVLLAACGRPVSYCPGSPDEPFGATQRTEHTAGAPLPLQTPAAAAKMCSCQCGPVPLTVLSVPCLMDHAHGFLYNVGMRASKQQALHSLVRSSLGNPQVRKTFSLLSVLW